MIGTGNAFSKTFYNNNALILRNKKMWLLDCGYLATRSLNELGISLHQLDGIIITHTHADHVGGLEEVAFRLKYEFKQRVNLYVPSSIVDSLWQHTLRGGLENTSEDLFELSDYFNVIPLYENHQEFIEKEFPIEIIKTLHVIGKDTFSVFIGEHVFYSSDMQFMPDFIANEVIEKRKCKSILHDCHLLGSSAVHASLDQLLTLPHYVQSITYLMHYGDLMEQYIGRTGNMTFLHQHQRYKFTKQGELLR